MLFKNVCRGFITVVLSFCLIFGTSSLVFAESDDTTVLSEDEIRETKEPVKIFGFTHYYQNQFPDVYLNNSIDGLSLPHNGAGVISICDVLVNMGIDETPETIVEYINENYSFDDVFRVSEIIKLVANKYGLSVIETESRDEAVRNLQDGGFIISLQGPGLFTRAGHAIVLCNYSAENDSVVVLDSNLNNREKESENNFIYKMDEIDYSNKYYYYFSK